MTFTELFLIHAELLLGDAKLIQDFMKLFLVYEKKFPDDIKLHYVYAKFILVYVKLFFIHYALFFVAAVSIRNIACAISHVSSPCSRGLKPSVASVVQTVFQMDHTFEV